MEERQIPCLLDTMVLELSVAGDGSGDKLVTAVSSKEGYLQLRAKAVVLAMGCRERPRGALNIAGSRPAGIYTAGAAQKFVNMKGYLPGKEVVILGSGDIGLIMARRMTLEGAKVKAVCELMPYSGGLTRNIVQCLNDFGIPLKLSHTVMKIHGKERVTGVTVGAVDASRKPIPGTEEYIPCDTLLLSVGLIPENELSRGAGVEMDPVTNGARVDQHRQTSLPGVFACGNVLHVHDLVDYVSEEAELAGSCAADYLKGGVSGGECRNVLAKNGVRYVVPQRLSIDASEPTALFFRVGDIYKNVRIVVKCGDKVLLSRPKKKVAPGEMERLTLTPQMLSQIDGDVTVCLEQEGAE